MSFVNPLFLIGGLVAGIPILLHLIKREHARKIEFSTLMFLKRISRRSIRYQKLRHLLLLLMRVLAFLLIVLAFMRPYREKPRASVAVGGITTAHILLLDNSLSMAYQDRWERARKAAVEIVRRSGRGDKFSILVFADRTAARTQFISEPAEAVSEIESLELSDQSTKYGQALRAAEKFAFDAGTGKRVIYLISDFQKNGWAAEERDFQLGAGIELRPVDLGSDTFSNLAFRDVHISGSDRAQGSEISIQALVENFGDVDRKNVHVRLFLDGRSVADKNVDVGRGSSQGIDFQLPGLTSGVHSVMLEVEDSYLTRDNRFHMTVEARAKTLVQVVNAGNADDRRSPGFFLAKALNVDALSPYRMETVSPQNLSVSGGLLIWNIASVGTVAVTERLRGFVKSGGGLAMTIPDGVQASEFNRTFGSWLPVRLEEEKVQSPALKRPAENYVLMTDVRMDHPIFHPFSRPNSGSFSGARFFRHAKLSVGSGADIPARFDNGDPALISINVEKGRVLIFTSSADDSGNDLPLKSVYAPFWQQMLHYLENFQERRHWLEVGDILAPKALLADAALRHSKGDMEGIDSIAVLDPKKQRLPLAPGSDSIALDAAGFYEIRAMNLSVSVAVNPMSKESDLMHGNAEEMTAGWVSSKPAIFSQDERPAPEEQDRRQRLWVLILIAAALLMISELVLSNVQPTAVKSKESADHPLVIDRKR
jgi:hypothetical protein